MDGKIVNKEKAKGSVRLVVISDTHVHCLNDLPNEVKDALDRADKIIHLGDFGDEELFRELKKTGRLIAVAGNHDTDSVKSALPKKTIIEINGKRLALIHGKGCYPIFQNRKKLLSNFKEDEVDAVLFGHTHVAANKTLEGVTFFNPGCTANKFPSIRPSYGILTIEKKIRAEVHYINYEPYPALSRWIRKYISRHVILMPPKPIDVCIDALVSLGFAYGLTVLYNMVIVR